MRGRKPRPIEIARDDLPLLQQIAHSQIRPWYQVRRARILLGIAHGARTQILAFLTQCDESTVPRTCRRYERLGLSGLLDVGNGQRGYNFFGQEGTSPKSVGFGGLVPAPCQSRFFPRIDLTTLLLGLKMASAVGAHFTGQGPSGHCSVVKRAELPAGNSSRVHPRHLPGRDPPSVWFTLDEH